ncbi:hypothetical protein OF83DRAFT_1178833 [Amylostereum chailletii]|nr:hypothetical protein OF83DRAFT_1178833 [Amylostereum chailletii]
MNSAITVVEVSATSTTVHRPPFTASIARRALILLVLTLPFVFGGPTCSAPVKCTRLVHAAGARGWCTRLVHAAGGSCFNTSVTTAGFQSRVGCLFFLCAFPRWSSAQSSRESGRGYTSPTTWLFSPFIFDVVALRIIPAEVVVLTMSVPSWSIPCRFISHVLSEHFGRPSCLCNADDIFKFLSLVLYPLAMASFNFFYGAHFRETTALRFC